MEAKSIPRLSEPLGGATVLEVKTSHSRRGKKTNTKEGLSRGLVKRLNDKKIDPERKYKTIQRKKLSVLGCNMNIWHPNGELQMHSSLNKQKAV
jgi:hypothetical protein